MDTITLEKRHLEFMDRIPPAVRRSITIEKDIDFYTKDLLVSLFAYVMCEKVHDDTFTKTFEWNVPSDWWQTLKEEKAPEWFLKRWPVKWKIASRTVTFHQENWVGYPELPLAISNSGHQMRVMCLSDAPVYEPLGMIE